MIVREDLLYAANSLSQLVEQSTKVIGPALGGVLVSFWSPDTAFAIDAVTFLVSAAILSRLGAIGVASGGCGRRRTRSLRAAASGRS